MTISGFTFVRNAVVFDYPMLESLNSLAPLCDEIVIAAGKSDDDTLKVLKSIDSSKIKIIETEWDKKLQSGGEIYSQQTNIALDECSGDWCIYLQADEVIHEKDYDIILNDIQKADNSSKAEAVLFRYKHFYGSYDYIGAGRQWYRREIRAFRNSGKVISWGDAQGFRKKKNDSFEKMRAIQSEADIFHYGWVRPPKTQYKKIKLTRNYYLEKEDQKLDDIEELDFDYNSAYELDDFKDSHPRLMAEKIKKDSEWTKYFRADKLKKKSFLHKLTDNFEKITGYRIGEFKDFIEVKP